MTRDFADDALRSLLDKKPGRIARALLWALSVAVFFVFARYARYAKIDDFSGYRTDELAIITATVFTAIFAVAYALQLRTAKSQNGLICVLLAVATGAMILAKISLLDYLSDDYDIFLSDWIYDYSLMSVKQGLGWYLQSDYTPPYLYVLLLISRLKDFPWQYMVKAFSVLMDVFMAYALTKLVSLGVRSEGRQLMTFQIAGILPTVVFNGAYWGQCDVVYVTFCLFALYCGLRRYSVRSMLLFGVALSFKLQTVFFLPVMLPLWLRKDIKLRHLVLIPAGYMLMMAPALWGGKSLHHVLTVYLHQAGAYNFITMNAPNWYQLLPDLDKGMLYDMFSPMAMMLGFACVMAMCAALCVRRERISVDVTLLTCVLMLAGIPYFLPKMHERYTYGADVLSLVLAIYAPRRAVLPLLFGFASYAAYTAGLPGERLMDLKWAAMFQGAAIALTAYELSRALRVPAGAATEVKG
ncbi:MAG: hypothetical protein Q4A66_11690 [Eubacteriales bacterium]|nr:hypothetical protein [Eubacteriales bacterium]